MNSNEAPKPTRQKVAFACSLILASLLALVACAGGKPGMAAATSLVASPATGAAFVQPETVYVPYGYGEGIDTSGVNQGWVSAAAWSEARLKFQVTCGDMTYNYDLPNDGTPTLYPINMGNGGYSFRIMLNTEGNNYVELNSAWADVWLDSECSPFLVPNQFCSYFESSACVEKARQLTAGADNQGAAVQAICTYVADNTSYDQDKAAALATATGYVPNPDETLSTGRGICFDYASLAAAMLRSMGFPTKIVTGYVGPEQLYHAWIMVFADGTWQTALFSVEPNVWSRCDVTFASTGATQYTGSGSGYTDKYTY